MDTQEGRLGHLISQIKDLAAAEYERGLREALARIANVVQREEKVEGMLPQSVAISGRLPRGTARHFIERALKSGSKTIREIRQSASTNLEKQVSYQTARLELERGKKEKRYRKHSGKWLRVD